MACPHTSKSDAGPCSQCCGAVPRVVTQTGRAILIDGKVVRTIDQAPRGPYTAIPQRRGDARRRRRRMDEQEAD